MRKIGVVLALTILYGIGLTGFWKMYTADIEYVKGRKALKNKAWEISKKHMEKAINFNPREPKYHREKAKMLIASDEKNEAIEELQKAVDLNSKNLATLRNIIPLYYLLTIKDLEKPNLAENIDESFLPTTKLFYENLKNTYKTDAGILVSIAKYEKQLKLQENYEKTVEMVGILRPDLLNWHESFR